MPADHKPKPGYSRFWPLPTSSERPLGAKSQRTSTLRRDFDSLSPSSEAPVSSAHSRTSDRKTLSRRPSSSRVAKSLRLTRSGANEPPRELKFMNGHVLCMDGRVISRFFATPEELKCARRLPDPVPWPEFLRNHALQNRFHQALACSKPRLIQELLCGDPWKLLVAVVLLNKTAGRVAIPIFWVVVTLWPTSSEMSKADVVRLTATLQPLGLQSLRAARLVELSRLYLSDPPDPACPRPSRNYPHPTPVSHLPGCGPYALDSYRIFCGKPDEWKEIRPSDKELIRYLRWRWASQQRTWWEPEQGPVRFMKHDDWAQVGVNIDWVIHG